MVAGDGQRPLPFHHSAKMAQLSSLLKAEPPPPNHLDF